MKHTYILKPFHISKYIEELDDKRRFKIEELLEKKFTNYEWFEYKKMMDIKNIK